MVVAVGDGGVADGPRAGEADGSADATGAGGMVAPGNTIDAGGPTATCDVADGPAVAPPARPPASAPPMMTATSATPATMPATAVGRLLERRATGAWEVPCSRSCDGFGMMV